MNAYEQLGNSPLGRVERVNLLDVAQSSVERAYSWVERAYEGMRDGDVGEWEMSEALRELKRVKEWLEQAMKKMEHRV